MVLRPALFSLSFHGPWEPCSPAQGQGSGDWKESRPIWRITVNKTGVSWGRRKSSKVLSIALGPRQKNQDSRQFQLTRGGLSRRRAQLNQICLASSVWLLPNWKFQSSPGIERQSIEHFLLIFYVFDRENRSIGVCREWFVAGSISCNSLTSSPSWCCQCLEIFFILGNCKNLLTVKKNSCTPEQLCPCLVAWSLGWTVLTLVLLNSLLRRPVGEGWLYSSAKPVINGFSSPPALLSPP